MKGWSEEEEEEEEEGEEAESRATSAGLQELCSHTGGFISPNTCLTESSQRGQVWFKMSGSSVKDRMLESY